MCVCHRDFFGHILCSLALLFNNNYIPLTKDSRIDDCLRDNICPWPYSMLIPNCPCIFQTSMLHWSLNSLSVLEFSYGNDAWTTIVVAMAVLFKQRLNNEKKPVMVHLKSTIIITSSIISIKIQCNNVAHVFPYAKIQL